MNNNKKYSKGLQDVEKQLKSEYEELEKLYESSGSELPAGEINPFQSVETMDRNIEVVKKLLFINYCKSFLEMMDKVNPELHTNRFLTRLEEI